MSPKPESDGPGLVCDAEAPVHESGLLCCNLDLGHPGIHYDATDHVSWQLETRRDSVQ